MPEQPIRKHTHDVEVTRGDDGLLDLRVPTLDDQAYTVAMGFDDIDQAAIDYLAVQMMADPELIEIRSTTFIGISVLEILGITG